MRFPLASRLQVVDAVLTKFLLTLGVALTLAGGYFSAQLYQTLRPDLEQLLPADSPSVLDLQAASQRLASMESLVVIVESEDTKASRRFVDEFARRMKRAPEGLYSGLEHKITNELDFFRKRMGLYMELEDLRRLRDQIDRRFEYERELYNPLHIFDEVELPEPRVDLERFVRRMGSSISAYARFPDGYYASQDQKIRLVLLNLPAGPLALVAAQKLRRHVDDVIAGMKPASYAPDLRVNFSGGAQNMIEEQAALFEDVATSTAIVMLFVTLVIYLYFRSGLGVAALLFSLLIGTLTTFGICYFLVDRLNANSAFLGSIVIGNGINYGVILLARYLEERRSHRDHAQAISIATRATLHATWTAALATGVAYGSLMLTAFRGFRQFGLIGLIGMVTCWAAAFLFLPPLLEVIDRRFPSKRPGELPPWIAPTRQSRLGGIVNLIGRFPRSILGLGVVATLLSLVGFTRISPDLIEADLSKLRSRESLEKGSGFHARKVDAVLKRYLTPVVVFAPSRAKAQELAAELRKKKDAEGSRSLFASVQTLDDFVPKQQAAKREILHDLRRLLGPREISLLPDAQKRLAESLISPESQRPVRAGELPELLRRKFRERNGSEGRLVVVEPPSGQTIRERENLFRFVAELRRAVDETAQGAPIAGTLPLTADLLTSIERDGPKATVLAFISVALVVTLLFRNRGMVALTLTSLLLGVSWLIGWITLSGQKINFLNFVALPIAFGIGVDYGVNVVQRYYLEGKTRILRVIRQTGSAVALCSACTIIGYGSLLMAQNQAFRSFGLVAIVGEFASIAAGLIFLPATLVLVEAKNQLADAKRRGRVRADRDEADRAEDRPRSA